MRIDLKWLDPNEKKKHVTEIYRSTEPFEDLGNAIRIVTVPAGTTEYQDANVVYKQVYYYMLKFVIPNTNRFALSKLYEFKASEYNGPGPTTLDFGDENFGYYGIIPTDLGSTPTIDDARAIFRLSPIQHTLNSTDLHKFAVGGTVRATFQYPVTGGHEIPRNHEVMATLLAGEPVHISKGLHKWAMLLPSADLMNSGPPDTVKYPGELRSMLGVITDLYSRIEDAQYGNQTGHKLTLVDGGINFYTALETMYSGFEFSYLATIDWLSTTQCNVIYWTPDQTVYPTPPKELHVMEVDYSDQDEWAKTLIWPVFVYLGLVGPEDRT